MIDDVDEPVHDPKEVEAVAKALYEHAVKEAREQVAAEAIPFDMITNVFKEAHKASDREAAIVVFCLVDDLTTEFFRKKLVGKVSGGIEDAFLAGNGMLASTYNKIALLAGLAWINEQTYRDLTLMRKIRNEFAHHVHYTSFDDEPICNFIGSMDAREELILNTMKTDRPEKVLMRSKFLVRAFLTVMGMVRDMAFIQAAIAHRIHPRSLSAGFEQQPENIQTLARTISRIALKVLLNQSRG